MNRLCNLVIDTIGANASKGSMDFTDKLKSLSERSIFLSQGELITFVKDKNNPVWEIGAIKTRHAHLVEFARKEWNPDTWHQPNKFPKSTINHEILL
jgi:hypothetical protein